MLHIRLWLAVVSAALVFAPAAPAADLKYLPDDTEMVLTINFKQILDSELAKGHKVVIEQVKGLLNMQLAKEPEAERYLKAAGFDLFRDLVSVTVAAPGKKQPEAIVIIEGTFDPEKFHSAAEEAAKNHGDVLKITKSGKFKLFEITPPLGKQAVVALAGNKTLLACESKERLQAALARHSGSTKGSLKKELETLLKTTGGTPSIVAVITGNALTKLAEGAPIPNAQQIGPALQTIEGISAAVTITKDVQFQIGVGTKDANVAKDFAQKANLGLLFAKGMLQQKAKEEEKLLPLVDILNSLRATAQDTSLLIRGEATVENIDKLMKNFKPKQ